MPALAKNTRPSRSITVLLVTGQILLAGLFIFSGGFKLLVPLAELTKQMPLPGAIVRLVGILELTGGLGLILPALLRLPAILTTLAAAGLVLVMCGATAATLAIGGGAGAIVPVVVGCALAAVGYGRWYRSVRAATVSVPVIRREATIPTARAA